MAYQRVDWSVIPTYLLRGKGARVWQKINLDQQQAICGDFDNERHGICS